MNSLHRTEIRTYHDLQAQADLERMLKNRRAAEAAREERMRKLHVPWAAAPKPEPFDWIDSAVFLTPMFVVAVLILAARWMGVLL